MHRTTHQHNQLRLIPSGLLVVAAIALLRGTGLTADASGASLYQDSLTGANIPNDWFLQHGLPLNDPTVPMQDPDKDGFTNEDEWRAQTDPTDRNSHPPYYSKLFLAKFIRVPFRFILKGYDGDPKGPADQLSFQIDTIDVRQPSAFLKIGDLVPKTQFKLQRFQFKQLAGGPNVQGGTDVSELTLVDVNTGDKLALILDRVTNVPDIYAYFVYEWPQPAMFITVRKLQEFVLRPEVDDQHHFKLLDVNDDEAVIQLPSGQKYTVKRDPRREPGK